MNNRKFHDLTGSVFSRLTVISRAVNRFGKVHWLCVCECGQEKIISSCNLVTGSIRSCGCLKREADGKRFAKHNLSKTSTYTIWMKMNYRCNNPNSKDYKDYGGRGIKVCDRWKDYTKFLEDMGERPPGLSIDRIDNDGHYSPQNCRWANVATQGRNKRTNRWIEHGGIKMILSDWANCIGISTPALHHRLKLQPLSVALTPGKRRQDKPNVGGFR